MVENRNDTRQLAMGKGFTLAIYPWVYHAKYGPDRTWSEEFLEKPHKTPEEEADLSPEELDTLLQKRNSFPELPLVNYTTQYGLGCFEGLKAFPQPDGTLSIFRPGENGKRMAKSMEGLNMPPFPPEMFLRACREVVRKNKALGFVPAYDPEWAKDGFVSGHSVYIRPFSYSEPAIGVSLSTNPWVVIVTTPVGSYFRPGNAKAVTTDKARATPNGTGWIKCSANYVIPALAKKEAEDAGYMEAIFLDALERTYIEEGSSCNIFFYMKNGTLVTPELGDTILPGINRNSVITLAMKSGVTTEERKISIQEAMEDAEEAFVTGTAVGVSYIESITHQGKTAVFGDGTMGELTLTLQRTLKGIQYGSLEDNHGWMVPV